MRKKIPPFAKSLIERQHYNNLPFLVAICYGITAWDDAKNWNKRPDNIGIVMEANKNPDSFKWPVRGCNCIIEWSRGPSVASIINVVNCILGSGAKSVVVWPKFVNHNSPSFEYDADSQTLVQVREIIRIFRGRNVDAIFA